MLMKKPSSPLYRRVREILESARAHAARSVNTAQVVANWLIGREIIEDQQQGRTRAGYGRETLQELSRRLQVDFGNGYSVDNLELFRRFYREYPDLISDAVRRISPGHAISDAARRKLSRHSPPLVAATPLDLRPLSGGEPWMTGRLHSNLSWTHYRMLLRVDRAELRREVRALTGPHRKGAK